MDVRGFRVRTGTVIGRQHLRTWRNNQDSVRTGAMMVGDRQHIFGIVCDGCSGGAHNEVGAQMLSTYLCNEIAIALSVGTPISELPTVLFIRATGYLRSIAALTVSGDQQQMVAFIKDHLLCTVLGFVLNDEECVIFSAGDGVIIINDEVACINENNQPMYLAYQLVDRAYLTTRGVNLPQSFTVRTIPTEQLQRVALFSDGISPEAYDVIWGHEHNLGLQRRLQVWARSPLAFDDDCTGVTIERINPQPTDA